MVLSFSLAHIYAPTTLFLWGPGKKKREAVGTDLLLVDGCGCRHIVLSSIGSVCECPWVHLSLSLLFYNSSFSLLYLLTLCSFSHTIRNKTTHRVGSRYPHLLLFSCLSFILTFPCVSHPFLLLLSSSTPCSFVYECLPCGLTSLLSIDRWCKVVVVVVADVSVRSLPINLSIHL
ncbi:MAG: hypothetical protein J3R72DRAFT_441027, partial [Linnemannia gamsii]